MRASDRDSNVDADSRERVGGRIDYIRAGTGLLGDADRRWQAGGYVQYDELDFGTAREDTLTTVGVSLRAFVTEASFVDFAASTSRRDSNDNDLDETTPVFSVQLGLEF